MAGALVMVRVKAWVAVPFTLLAVRVSGYTPAAAFAGVPEIVAVPSPLLVNLTPEGSWPVLVMVGAGEPDVVTVKVNRVPAGSVASGLLVKAGAPLAGVIAMATAPLPNRIRGPGVLVAVAIGVTELEPPLFTSST